jgi:hypothetical protein
MNGWTLETRKHVTPNEFRQLRERLKLYHGVDISSLGEAEGISESEIAAELESIRVANRAARREVYKHTLPIVAVAAIAAAVAFGMPRESGSSYRMAMADRPTGVRNTVTRVQRDASSPVSDLYTTTESGAVQRASDSRNSGRPAAVVATASSAPLQQAAQAPQTRQSSNAVTSLPAQSQATGRTASVAPATSAPGTTYQIAVPTGNSGGLADATSDSAVNAAAADYADAQAAAAAASAANPDVNGTTPQAADANTDTTSATGNAAPATPSVTVVMPVGVPYGNAMSGTRFRRVSSIGTPVPHGALPFHTPIRRR